MSTKRLYRHHLTKQLMQDHPEGVLIWASTAEHADFFRVKKVPPRAPESWRGEYVAEKGHSAHCYYGTLRDLKEWIGLHR